MEDLATSSRTEPDEESLNRTRAVFANTLDRVQVYFRHQQRLDDLRRGILEELAQSTSNVEDSEMNSVEKLSYVMGLQKKLYDLQLLESASKAPLFGIAKTIFSLSKKRTMPKVEETVKEKPSKSKLNTSTASFKDSVRKQQEKVAVTPKPSLNASTSNLNSTTKEDGPSNAPNSTPRIGRRLVRRRRPSFTHKVDSRASMENDDERDVKPSKMKREDPPETSPPTPVPDEPTEKVTRNQKRNAAVAAMAANAELSTPRATSPRKRANHNNSHAATPVEEVSPDEPTYCICKQVSFGDMICCDYSKCTIEWFHFGCVNIKVKPTKGKKWYCPDCRHGDKQSVLKPSLANKK